MSFEETTPKIFTLKGFSPLRTPDVTKKKKKKKQKRNESHSFLSDTESVVDKDILNVANFISNRLKEIDCAGKNSDSSLEETTSQHKTSNINSNVVTHDNMTGVEVKENISMDKISPKKKKKQKKDHHLSDSDVEMQKSVGITDIEKGVTPSPGKTQKSVGITDIEKGVAPSPGKTPSKSKRIDYHKKKSPIKNISADIQNEDIEKAVADNEHVQLRYKPDTDFVMMTGSSPETQLSPEDVKGKDLWLIKAPIDFDVKNLDNKIVSLKGLQTISTDSENEFEVHAFEDNSLSMLALQPVIPCKKKKAYTTGQKFKGQIHIIQTMEVPPLPNIIVPKPVRHVIPPGLKPRFEPFGSASPEREIVSEDSGSSSRKRKHQTEIKEDIETPSKNKKKKKKHKHHKT